MLTYKRNDDESLRLISGFDGVFEGAHIRYGYDTGGIYTVIAYYPDGRTEIRTGDDAIKQVTNINNKAIFQETEETRKTKDLVSWLNSLKFKQRCTTT